MENASKALIIAGAILIAILLISVGIILVNAGKDVTETGTAGMASQKIQSFNAQFTAYEGSQTGSKLKALIGTLIANSDTYQYEIEKIPYLIVVDKIDESGEELENATIENEDERIINVFESVQSGTTYFIVHTETLLEGRMYIFSPIIYLISGNYPNDEQIIDTYEQLSIDMEG